MDLSLIIHYILDREDVVNEAVGVTDVMCLYGKSVLVSLFSLSLQISVLFPYIIFIFYLFTVSKKGTP